MTVFSWGTNFIRDRDIASNSLQFGDESLIRHSEPSKASIGTLVKGMFTINTG